MDLSEKQHEHKTKTMRRFLFHGLVSLFFICHVDYLVRAKDDVNVDSLSHWCPAMEMRRVKALKNVRLDEGPALLRPVFRWKKELVVRCCPGFMGPKCQKACFSCRQWAEVTGRLQHLEHFLSANTPLTSLASFRPYKPVVSSGRVCWTKDGRPVHAIPRISNPETVRRGYPEERKPDLATGRGYKRGFTNGCPIHSRRREQNNNNVRGKGHNGDGEARFVDGNHPYDFSRGIRHRENRQHHHGHSSSYQHRYNYQQDGNHHDLETQQHPSQLRNNHHRNQLESDTGVEGGEASLPDFWRKAAPHPDPIPSLSMSPHGDLSATVPKFRSVDVMAPPGGGSLFGGTSASRSSDADRKGFDAVGDGGGVEGEGSGGRRGDVTVDVGDEDPGMDSDQATDPKSESERLRGKEDNSADSSFTHDARDAPVAPEQTRLAKMRKKHGKASTGANPVNNNNAPGDLSKHDSTPVYNLQGNEDQDRNDNSSTTSMKCPSHCGDVSTVKPSLLLSLQKDIIAKLLSSPSSSAGDDLDEIKEQFLQQLTKELVSRLRKELELNNTNTNTVLPNKLGFLKSQKETSEIKDSKLKYENTDESFDSINQGLETFENRSRTQSFYKTSTTPETDRSENLDEIVAPSYGPQEISQPKSASNTATPAGGFGIFVRIVVIGFAGHVLLHNKLCFVCS